MEIRRVIIRNLVLWTYSALCWAVANWRITVPAAVGARFGWWLASMARGPYTMTDTLFIAAGLPPWTVNVVFTLVGAWAAVSVFNTVIPGPLDRWRR